MTTIPVVLLLLANIQTLSMARTTGLMVPSPLPWYLDSPHGAAQHSINVTGVWAQGITGRDKTVCIVSNGVNMLNQGVRSSYSYLSSADFVSNGPDPMPEEHDYEGTLSALEIGGSGTNGCPKGIAYGGRVSGARIMATKPALTADNSADFVVDDFTLARALTYEIQRNDIFSCSWVFPDGGRRATRGKIERYVRRALAHGAQHGRGGLGNVYVFNADNNAHDGHKDSIHAISVGNIDENDRPLVTGKVDAAQMVVSYASGSTEVSHLATDDACSLQIPGPSCGSSLVAGVYALVLEVNPLLTLRDIQWLTVNTAVQVDYPEIKDYQMNIAMNKMYSHQVGFGKVDAWAMVEMAKQWTPINALGTIKSPWYSVSKGVPFADDDAAIVSQHEIFRNATNKWDPDVVEHIIVQIQLNGHSLRRDLSVKLISPTGMVSHFMLAETPHDHRSSYFNFTSVAHWGENTVGSWRLAITHRSGSPRSSSATLVQWRMKIYGQLADVPREVIWPLLDDPRGPHFEDFDTQVLIQNATSVLGIGGHGNIHEHVSPHFNGLLIAAGVIFILLLSMVVLLRYTQTRQDKQDLARVRYEAVSGDDSYHEVEKPTSSQSSSSVDPIHYPI